MDNTLNLSGTVGCNINNNVVKDFLSKMAGAPIEVRMHTFGGSVFEGNLIYNSFKSYTGKKTLIIEGVCASMGSIIMGAFDEVQIVKNGFVMIHTPWGYSEGNASAHESSAKLLRLMGKNFKEVYKLRTEYDLNTLMDGNDHWFDAEEALSNGFVDAIIQEEIPFDIEVEGNYSGLFSKQINFLKTNYQGKFKPTNNNQINNNQNFSKMKKIIAVLMAFGLALQVDTSEDEVANLIKSKFKEKDDEIDRLNGLLKKQVEESKKAILDNALNAGRINQEQYGKLSELAKKFDNVDDVNSLVDSVAAPVSISSIITNTASTAIGRENWTWNDYQEKDVAALERMEKEDPKAWQKLYDLEYRS